MTAQNHVPSAVSRTGAVSALALAALTGTLVAPGAAPEAQAAGPAYATKALNVAASKKGSPYKYGAAGPSRFDCSGLTLYAYKQAGKTLPRTAQQQYNRTRHISASALQKGDLVFFHSGGRVYHVGVYAGSNRIWHAPKAGTVVRLERIWTGKVLYGRVR
ncbi:MULTISPECIES: C40 family peptidase [Streptomyces]|uniref:C40 family peptidase n=1 Tax=Streptomyces sudanensis TaxID=436397 RepID=A0ABY4T7L9_9ACTN|nr:MULTISPECIES: C40 family peptidase [Streptomyces]MCP9956263.1 C40 family peptidase [Streptomyces sudanensis]MCP9985475.1 C40 family peptidase [Streptomyces sudanensis]MCQ0003107.1 C40 family peptidase [Streptomyces sudanensis]URN14692.1 C40 family peptidase [Streptomyces sudanensis]